MRRGPREDASKGEGGGHFRIGGGGGCPFLKCDAEGRRMDAFELWC